MSQPEKTRPEDLFIVNGSLSDIEVCSKFPEPLFVTVATPFGIEHYKMYRHGALLVLEWMNTEKAKALTEPPLETEPVVAEQPDEPPRVEVPEVKVELVNSPKAETVNVMAYDLTSKSANNIPITPKVNTNPVVMKPPNETTPAISKKVGRPKGSGKK